MTVKQVKAGDQEYTIQEVEVVQKTILVHEKFWNTENIANLLKAIESEEGFRGFVKVHFEVDTLPEITYLVNYKKPTV